MVRGDEEGGSIWLKNPQQAKSVAERLVAMRPAHVEAIFYRSAPGNNYDFVQASPNSWLVKPAVGDALRYLVNTTAGVNGPDMYVLYRENYTVVARNVAGTWKGTHGGSTWYVQHVPLVISGPGIRRGVTSSFPARAIDIAPTMERLLGLPAIQRDGVILADAFSTPMTGELGPQKAAASSLSAYVSELQQQSLADVRGTPVKWPTVTRPGVPCFNNGKQQIPCKTTAGSATNQ